MVKNDKKEIKPAGAGRPLKFPTPKKLWETFKAYKKWAKENPINKPHCLKDGTIIQIPVPRPYTMFDFATFCGMHKSGIDNYGTREDHKIFFGVYRRIHNEISSQRLGGAMCDVYNANLTARLDGLAEKNNIEAKVETNEKEIDLSNLTDDEKMAFSKLLEKLEGGEQ